ncbi:MEMBRANE LIPOPROTEIN-RELATED [Salix koriyanagi]|uniref:MEMBRANE LIPOPROTEIN-RELATED n=1 Tax=Salix koriyanagi TaxID=2511006 RepID=A0A9Q0P6W6_9ROSI|nr:MEMBRANE LIPOPROTEIN-RELATED [Salix koriyanagi]
MMAEIENLLPPIVVDYYIYGAGKGEEDLESEQLGAAYCSCILSSPTDPSRAWLPVAGIALVCMPWIFWLLTCIYRIFSRLFGFRVAIGSGGGGAGGGRARANVFNETGNAATNIGQSGNVEAQGDEAQDEFDGPTITVEKNDSGGNGNTGIKRSSSSGNSINNMSFRSHESELPLAPSMAP